MSYEDLKEERVLSTFEKPFSYFSSKIPDYFPFVPSHWHPQLEINYMLEGRAIHNTDGEVVHSSPGDIFVIPPNALHSISADSGNYAVYDTLVFDLNALIGSPAERSAVNYLEPLRNSQKTLKTFFCPGDCGYEQLRPLIVSSFTAAKSDAPAEDLLLKSNVLGLLHFFITQGYCRNNGRSPSQRAHLNSMRTVIRYINERYHFPIRIAELAALTCQCESSFMTAFQEIFGVTAMEYITDLRIRTACRKLLKTDAPVLEIAAACGYPNLSNFNRLFKRMVGQTPSAYRKAVRDSTEK